MEREHFRRTAPTKSGGYSRENTQRRGGRTPNDDKERKDFRETFVMQLIVSGIVLAFVMVVCLVDTDFTDGIKSNLKTALNEKVSFETAKSTGIKMAENIISMKDSVLTIFGGTGGEDSLVDSQIDENATVINAEGQASTSTPTPTDSNEKAEDRIDEDILKQINGKQDFYGESEKKSIVPMSTPTLEQEN